MNGFNNSGRFPLLAKTYGKLWRDYQESDVDKTIDTTDKENDFSSEWQLDHYFDVGVNAVRIICESLLISGRDIPKSILDFPCGSGRVTRHLKAMFPGAAIAGCDLYESHVEFVARQFGVIPIVSKENFDELDVGQWDLIFCGSLLTHLPSELFWKAARFMVRSLSPNGIAVFTTEGRHSVHIHDHKWKLIEDNLFEVARRKYLEDGFGFVDYNEKFLSDAFGSQETYGVALTNPGWLMQGLASMEDIRILHFAERAWDDHQDVVVIGKPAVNA